LLLLNENDKPESNSAPYTSNTTNTATISTIPINTNRINKISFKKTTKSTKKASSPLRKNIHVDANKNDLIF
jgi:hypothetical protein